MITLYTRQENSAVTIGGREIVFMAGPCAVESYEQTRACALALKQVGGRILRGGAFKPRTSPYTFQGLGLEGLSILRAVADELDLLVVTEALSVENVPMVCEYTDIVQVGTRNMQHYPLLWALGEVEKPVMLKRGFMSSVHEWLLATEHIIHRGNENIILCERGIRTFDTYTHCTLDINAIALLKATTGFAVIADPSHGTGRADLVLPVAQAAIAAGADGLLVEFHPDPINALSDREQAIPLAEMGVFHTAVNEIAAALGRSVR